MFTLVECNAECPHYVALGNAGKAGVKIVHAALLESCDIATQPEREPALVVLMNTFYEQ